MINIAGLDKAEVLAALYNRAQALGMGLLHYDPTPMTPEEAKEILDGTICDLSPGAKNYPFFDYLKGRVMKVNIAGEELDERLYDRDNGTGAAFRALEQLLKNKKQ